MVKGRLTIGSSKPKEASQLADMLSVGGNKKVYLTYNNQEIAVTDAIKTSGKVILITEVNGKAVQAKWLAEELRQSTGLPVFVEIEGKEIPAQEIIANRVKANKMKAAKGKVNYNPNKGDSYHTYKPESDEDFLACEEDAIYIYKGSATKASKKLEKDHFGRPYLRYSMKELQELTKATVNNPDDVSSIGEVIRDDIKGIHYTIPGYEITIEPKTFDLIIHTDTKNADDIIRQGLTNTFMASTKKASNGIKDTIITLITMVLDSGRGTERLLSQMVGSLTDQEVKSINNHLSSQLKLTKSQSSLLFTIKAEIGKRNLTASNDYLIIEDQPLETEAADFVKPVFTDKDYEDFDAQVKVRFKVSAEVAEAGKDTLSITFEPIKGGVDLGNSKFQSQLEDFIKFTFGGEFKKAVTDIDTVEEDYLVILVDYSKVKVLKAFDDSELETEAAPKVTPMLKKDHPELLKKTKAQLLVKKAMSLFSHNK